MAFNKQECEIPEDGVVRLLQVTDTHLFADADGELLSVNTRESYQAVLAAIAQNQESFQYVLATGDLSQDQSAHSYELFAEGVAQLAKPCFWLPGNHDESMEMKRTLDKCGISRAKQLLMGHWQIILLDSQVYGVPYGQLSESQYEFLERALAEYPDKHTLIALHHQPLLVGCDWLDQHNLKRPSRFFGLLQANPQVKGVLFGHVHQQFDRHHEGVLYMATPSTCIQFKPESDEFALDSRSPGWRYLQLHPDGRIASQVWRLPENSFTPDMASTGY